MTSNPHRVADLFERTEGEGIAQQVKAFADGMSDPNKGVITASITGNQASIVDLTTQINAWQPLLTPSASNSLRSSPRWRRRSLTSTPQKWH